MKTKEFYYIDCVESYFAVTLKDLCDGPQPILWHNKGMYRLIPLELVDNAMQTLEDTKQFSNDGDYVFMWDYTIEVPQEIGNQLTNKQFNHDTEQDED